MDRGHSLLLPAPTCCCIMVGTAVAADVEVARAAKMSVISAHLAASASRFDLFWACTAASAGSDEKHREQRVTGGGVMVVS